jgi:hypothetical protein
MPTIQEKIINKALEILETKPEGLHYSDLHRAIQVALPEVVKNTIDGTIWRLDKSTTNVAKPERGLFILTKYLTPEKQDEISKKKLFSETSVKEVIKRAGVPDETKFYQPFADYLVNDLEECTGALPLGGSKFGDKWGTPDVLGVYKFSEADPLRPATEIIVNEFSGKCIAIIHRKDDNDDKLVIVPENAKQMSDEEILKAVNFQEKWFDSIVIR